MLIGGVAGKCRYFFRGVVDWDSVRSAINDSRVERRLSKQEQCGISKERMDQDRGDFENNE